MNARIERINELIKQHTNNIILKDLSLKDGVFITIAKVDTTPDLRYTRVSISVFPYKESDYALKTLNKEIYTIQGALNKKLAMRPLPRIEFILDSTEEEADKIEKILKEV